MAIQPGLKLTTAGAAEFAAAVIEERSVDITQMALGDANGAWYEVTGAEPALLHEQWRGPLLQITIDPAHANRIICDAPIPTGTGGFTIREFGLLSASGILMAIGMHQVIELPAPGDPTTMDMIIRGLLDVVNAAVVNLTVDPSIVTATRAFVEGGMTAHNTASTETEAGHVQLATIAETLTGLLDSKAVHPAGLQAALDALHAAILGGATPEQLDTIHELAEAFQNNPDTIANILDQLGQASTALAAHTSSTDPHPAVRAHRYFFGQI